MKLERIFKSKADPTIEVRVIAEDFTGPFDHHAVVSNYYFIRKESEYKWQGPFSSGIKHVLPAMLLRLTLDLEKLCGWDKFFNTSEVPNV